MNKLSLERRARILSCLCEGSSVRATSRMQDCSRDAVLKLIEDAGAACAKYHDEHVREIAAEHVQADEIWSFCYAKAKNVPEEKRGQFGFGDTWTWTALDAESKLMIAWHLGPRNADAALKFMRDLADRLKGRVQLTTDGHPVYLGAVARAFGSGFVRDAIDYAMLVKIYGKASEGDTRYSPPVCLGSRREVISGDPDPEHINTSFVERANLSIRMSNRRYTRLTNAFSKKIENHRHMFAIFCVYYNFVRVHQTLRATPAMAAGISDHAWKFDEMAALADSH